MMLIIRLSVLALLISCCTASPLEITAGLFSTDSSTTGVTGSKHHTHNVSTYGVRNPGAVVCSSGQQQSPIDINTHHCKTKHLPHVQFADNILFENDVIYENNCETVKITIADHSLKPKVKGGTMDSDVDYIIDNIHFHWGSNDTDGCEHTIGGKHFQVEAHIVLYKCTEKDLDTALANGKVAVLGFLFEFKGKSINPELHDIIKGITEVLQPHSSFKAPGSSLCFFKNYINGGFYAYQGSLTTHTCTEGITWMIFKKLIPMAHSQLLIFHDVIGEDENEMRTWRKTLPLNGREVDQTSY